MKPELIRHCIERATERQRGFERGTESGELLGDPALAAFAHLGRLAMRWADALEHYYKTPGSDDAPLFEAESDLLRALLPADSEALRWRT